MKDEIIQEVWKAKDSIAARHHYDVGRLVAHLCAAQKSSGARVVDLHARQVRDSASQSSCARCGVGQHLMARH
uniref:Uncharacterized protein n=1 Tax=Candidatus Kentrum sp. DK TaxID=2126562 RepID=A0A450S012_9GAMM|nr:MAG: hypothetical protein BECKDK2373C_GA0170839_100925 [Candidatus Kentron sp. DK]VFJ44884.1 MAG: hypothetical protein BECKDK2373B_GA0170837_100835 [Candidatus Kentron sp. DK]